MQRCIDGCYGKFKALCIDYLTFFLIFNVRSGFSRVYCNKLKEKFISVKKEINATNIA